MMTTKEVIEQIRNESMKYAKVAIEELLAGETTTTEEEEKKVSYVLATSIDLSVPSATIFFIHPNEDSYLEMESIHPNEDSYLEMESNLF